MRMAWTNQHLAQLRCFTTTTEDNRISGLSPKNVRVPHPNLTCNPHRSRIDLPIAHCQGI